MTGKFLVKVFLFKSKTPFCSFQLKATIAARYSAVCHLVFNVALVILLSLYAYILVMLIKFLFFLSHQFVPLFSSASDGFIRFSFHPFKRRHKILSLTVINNKFNGVFSNMSISKTSVKYKIVLAQVYFLCCQTSQDSSVML